MKQRKDNISGPLRGVRVLDFTGVVSGPLATMFLADQGADVIKIEPLNGDITRRSRNAIGKAGEFSALFISSNRGKRSLAIDAKSPGGREVIMKLLADADVLVENFRPGAMERLGFGAEQLAKAFPRLIYASINGVGESGPYASKRVYDPIIQALSGFADIQRDPVTKRPRMIRTIVADKTSAVFCAQAISSALYARERTGAGQHVRVAMLDVMLAHLWPEGMMQYTVVGAEATTGDPNARPDQVFETTDGYITVGTISDSEWNGFCVAAHQPALKDDPRFNSAGGRFLNTNERLNLMAELIKTSSTDDWLARLDAADVPNAPILRREQIVDNEQIVARQLITEFDQPNVGRVRQPVPAARFEGTPSAIQGPAPGVGEHSIEILRELGYPQDQIDTMARGGVIRI